MAATGEQLKLSGGTPLLLPTTGQLPQRPCTGAVDKPGLVAAGGQHQPTQLNPIVGGSIVVPAAPMAIFLLRTGRSYRPKPIHQPATTTIITTTRVVALRIQEIIGIEGRTAAGWREAQLDW